LLGRQRDLRSGLRKRSHQGRPNGMEAKKYRISEGQGVFGGIGTGGMGQHGSGRLARERNDRPSREVMGPTRKRTIVLGKNR